MLIFGSTAMKHWWSHYPKCPKDLDVISKEKSKIVKDIAVEYHWCDAMQYVVDNNKDELYVDPNFLFTIKASHLPWEGNNGKWWKHLKDFVFMQNEGCEIDWKLFEQLQKEWSTRFGDKSKINLNNTVDKFFNSAVERKYNHDWLHEYFKIGSIPAYKLMQKDGEKALVNKDMFDSLTTFEKHCTILEEMQVIAFERKLTLPNAYKVIVTRLSKGWWNTFCILSAKEVLDGYLEEKKQYELLRRKLNENSSAD